MSKSFRFVLNYAGVGKLLKSNEMKGVLQGAADRVQRTATAMTGLEYQSDVNVLGTRAVSTIATNSPHAYSDSLKNNTLEKALGGG